MKTTLVLCVLVLMSLCQVGTAQAPQVQTLQQYLDQVLLIVAPIEIWCGPSRIATATGFFFVNENKLYLVTNRHVVRDDQNLFFPDKLRLRLHTNAQDHTQNADYDVPLYRDKKSVWREKPGVDLVAIELPAQEIMSRFVVQALAPSYLPPADLVVAPGDDLFIVGYPRGFSDLLRNYPIVRMGAVASSYPTPFQGRSYFLVDARLHPGTSGSPVFTKPTNMLRTSSATIVGGYRMFFLGVNSGEVNFGESSGLNTVWYASEVVALTAPSFHSQPVQQP